MDSGARQDTIFERAPSGLLVPVGLAADMWKYQSSTYAHIKGRAIELLQRFEANGLDVRRSSSIQSLARQASELSDAWLCDEFHTVTFDHVLAMLQIDRIATAALAVPRANEAAFLKDLLNGSLDLLKREQSKAKDTLWELELLRILTDHQIPAELREPDILFSLSGPALGVACKKLYSEGNVSKVVSNAVSQIERDAEFGIVALNIDDLLPADVLLKAETTEKMTKSLVDFVQDFMARHERHFRRYLQPGRALAILASCSTIADLSAVKARFVNARQSVAWAIPGMTPDKERQLDEFIRAFQSQYPEETRNLAGGRA